MMQEPFDKKILIVEDEETIRVYLHKLLSMKGYSVQTVATGAEAFKILSEKYYPVVITDLLLPDFRGTEILDYIKKNSICSAVLIITAHKSADTVIEALRQGAYDYITKPFSSQVLLHRVAGAMEKIRLEEVARSLSSKIIYSTEEERQRLSRDIHDGIGQSLTIIKLTLQTIKKQIPGPKKILKEMDGLANYVEETMVELSRIARDLSPAYVTQVGLPRALRLYLETFSKTTRIRVQSSLPEEVSFQNPQHEIHIFRIAQEALTNIAKHAKATAVEINLVASDDRLMLSISDNGEGFKRPQESQIAGLGLIGIKERAAAMDGKILIETKSGRGSIIRLEAPYDANKF